MTGFYLPNWAPRWVHIASTTNWRNFLRKNGPGEIIWKQWTGWKEQYDSLDLVGNWSGLIKGGVRGPEGIGMFYQAATLSRLVSSDKRFREDKMHEVEARLDSYASADCRCRLGWHWKCKVHQNWEN